MKLQQKPNIGLMRLAAHRITSNISKSPEDAVKHMLALQAQDYNGGLWSVGIRTIDATQHQVESAIRERKIIRTWPMRGTLHLVHADDVHWLLCLLAARATAAATGRRINQLGLTDAIVARAEQVLRSELAGNKVVTRTDIIALLKQNVKGIEILNEHTQHLLRHFGERGVICFGPQQAKQPTCVLLDDWVEKPEIKSRPAALRELALRYFVSHGPATLKDFAGWGMIKITDARIGLEAAKNDLEELIVDDKQYFHAKGLSAPEQSDVLLLPGFDEFILGYKDRSDVLDAAHAQKVVPGNNGMFLSTVVKDGQVIRLWKKQIKKSSIVFSYEDFDTAEIGGGRYESAEQRYQSFIDGDIA